jgi:hypothetical protein
MGTQNNFDLADASNPYGHLWMSVLRQAMEDATLPTNSPEERLERREARKWLRYPGSEVGSVRWVCEVLGLNHEALLTEFGRRAK